MQLAGSRFFSYNLYPLEILQSSVVPELLFVLPIFGPGLDVLNFFDLVVDVTCVGNKRIFTIEGQRCVYFTLCSCMGNSNGGVFWSQVCHVGS